jgi:ABC-type multidrug transport system fused ATPase/permease subunit
VLLDDPLSAVDAPTAKFLVDNAIRRVLKGRTCILVTHAVSLVLPYADYAIIIKNGEVLDDGHPQDLIMNPKAEGLFGLDLSNAATEEVEYDQSLHGPIMIESKSGKKLVNEEEKATGSVRFEIYSSYFKASGGVAFAIIFFFSFFVCSIVQFGNDWWLKNWTDHAAEIVAHKPSNISLSYNMLKVQSAGALAEMKQHVQTPAFAEAFSLDQSVGAGQDITYYLTIYGLFGLGIITSMNLQTLVTLVGCLLASRKLHNNLLSSVMNAPLRFFEVTPIGRILNRFSKDIENVDT